MGKVFLESRRRLQGLGDARPIPRCKSFQNLIQRHAFYLKQAFRPVAVAICIRLEAVISRLGAYLQIAPDVFVNCVHGCQPSKFRVESEDVSTLSVLIEEGVKIGLRQKNPMSATFTANEAVKAPFIRLVFIFNATSTRIVDLLSHQVRGDSKVLVCRSRG